MPRWRHHYGGTSTAIGRESWKSQSVVCAPLNRPIAKLLQHYDYPIRRVVARVTLATPNWKGWSNAKVRQTASEMVLLFRSGWFAWWVVLRRNSVENLLFAWGEEVLAMTTVTTVKWYVRECGLSTVQFRYYGPGKYDPLEIFYKEAMKKSIERLTSSEEQTNRTV